MDPPFKVDPESPQTFISKSEIELDAFCPLRSISTLTIHQANGPSILQYSVLKNVGSIIENH